MLEEVAGHRAEQVSEGCARPGALLADIAKCVCARRSGNMWWARQRESAVGEEKKMGGGSCLRENLASILYLCLFFSGNGVMCWQEASGCCQRYEHLGALQGSQVLKCSCHSILLTKGVKRPLLRPYV